MPRVALVTTSWPSYAGDPSGHFVECEARALERSGAHVTLVAPSPGGAFGWPGVAARVREDPLRAFSAARWVAGAALRVRSLDVDRVVCHWAVPSAWPIAYASRAPVEIVSHGGDVRLLLALPSPARSRLTRTLAARCSAWRFVSDALLESLLASVDRAAASLLARVSVVRPALIDVPDVADAVRLLRPKLPGARTAVSVGRLVESKRVDRAIAHVAAGNGFDALVVVGDGPERGRLETVARSMRAPAHFVGALPRSEALAWIGAADALIHASKDEGLSTVVREAEALGTRVVRV
jgi:glycosyltransferase involved in cell wall biosynthesis